MNGSFSCGSGRGCRLFGDGGTSRDGSVVTVAPDPRFGYGGGHMTSTAPATLVITDTAVPRPADRRAYRLSAIDMVRGLVIIIMVSPRGVPEMGGSILLLMQVIWAIGATMLVLAALQYLGRRVCLVLGLAIVVSHNLLDRFWVGNALLEQRPLWVALHAQMSFHIGPFQLAFVYPILAWIGVMLVGFGVSEIFECPAARRNAVLFRVGAALTAAFVVLRALDSLR